MKITSINGKVLFLLIVVAVCAVAAGCREDGSPVDGGQDGGVRVDGGIIIDGGYQKVAAPVFDPAGDKYYMSQIVTISCSTEGASIKYTTDGATPSQSIGIQYTKPVIISSGSTLKAVAYLDGLEDSDVVSGNYNIFSISAGSNFTCSATLDGGAKCWGLNEDGRLGNGTITNSKTPTFVTGLTSGTGSATTGIHACSLTRTGGVKCWGANDYGQLGNGTNTGSNVPVDVTGLGAGVRTVSTGSYHTCAITGEGALKCWGANDYGQLGNGTNIGSNVPVDVTGLNEGVKYVSAGSYHTCAITGEGALKCWGENKYGQLGNGTTTESSTPVDVTGLGSGADSVSAAWRNTCALNDQGTVKCWGANDYGQLGNGTNTASKTPVSVSNLPSGASMLSMSVGHACVVTQGGAIKCWGLNSGGQLGDGSNTNRNIPVNVYNFNYGAGFVSAGYYHTCAISADFEASCWGLNDSGQLGNGTTTSSNKPVDVTGL